MILLEVSDRRYKQFSCQIYSSTLPQRVMDSKTAMERWKSKLFFLLILTIACSCAGMQNKQLGEHTCMSGIFCIQGTAIQHVQRGWHRHEDRGNLRDNDVHRMCKIEDLIFDLKRIHAGVNANVLQQECWNWKVLPGLSQTAQFSSSGSAIVDAISKWSVHSSDIDFISWNKTNKHHCISARRINVLWLCDNNNGRNVAQKCKKKGWFWVEFSFNSGSLKELHRY